MTIFRHRSQQRPRQSRAGNVCGLIAAALIVVAVGVSPGSAQTKAGGAPGAKARSARAVPGSSETIQQKITGAIKLGVPRVSRSVMPADECKKFKSKLVDRAAAKAANACDVVSTVTVTATQPAVSPSPSAVQSGCEGIGYRIHAQWRSDVYAWSASQDDWIDFYGTPSPCTNSSVSAHTIESINEHYCRADYGIGFGVDITQCYTSGNGSQTAIAGMRFTVHVIADQVPIFFGHGVDITATNVNFTNEWAISGF